MPGKLVADTNPLATCDRPQTDCEILGANTKISAIPKTVPVASKIKELFNSFLDVIPNLSRAEKLPECEGISLTDADTQIAASASGNTTSDTDKVADHEHMFESSSNSVNEIEGLPVTTSTPDKKTNTVEEFSITETGVKTIVKHDTGPTEQNISLQLKLKASNATIESLSKVRNEQKVQLSLVKAKLAELEIDLANKDIELASQNKIEKENKSIKNAVSKLKKEITKVESKNKQLEQENNSLKAKCEQLEIKAASVLELKNDLELAQAKLLSLEPEEPVLPSVPTNEGLCIPVLIGRYPQVQVNHTTARTQCNRNVPVTTKPASTATVATAPEENKKIKVRVVGDSMARGMGPQMQTAKMDSVVVTNPGASLHRLKKMTSEKWQEHVLVTQCGIDVF
jgi:hypothetical protein